MCFGSSKTTTNNNSTTANTAASAPTNPTIQPAITNEVNAATSLASQPLQQYTGNLVAPLTDTQNEAISEIQGAQGLAEPDLTAAATYAQQGATPITATPFSADAVNQYESPYLSDVLNTTEAAENLQDQQQQQSLQGNITAAGAWGGDRSAVVQSQLAGQQAVANNSTNAGIENQGYTQALGQFNTTNQLGLQTQEANDANAQNTAYTLGNLGTNIQNSALTGAGALLNAGTLQQQVNQENLNVPYEQYLQQQAYPYQNLDFESGILGSAAGTSGTTSNQSGSSTGTNQQSTSTPLGPQLLGLGLSAASLFKSGGRTRLAPGGMAPDIYEQPTFTALPTPVSLSSYIPTDSSAGKSGLQSLSAGSTPMAPSGGGGNAGSGTAASGVSQGLSEGNQIGAALQSPGLGGYIGTDPTYTGTNAPFAEGLFGNAAGYGGLFGSAAPTVSAPDFSPSTFDMSGLGLSTLKKGGRTRLADGGTDDAGSQFDTLLDSLYPGDADAAPAPSQGPTGATAMSLQDTPPAWRDQATNYADQPSEQSMSLSDGPAWDDGTPVVAPPVDEDADTVDNLGKASSLATATPGAAQPASDAAGAGLGIGYAPKIVQNAYQPTPDWRRALLTAGTSMLAARGGNGLSNVGAGLEAGVNEYYNQLDKDNNPSVDHSGPTTLVHYADGTVVDTGLPTEAALSAKASNDYKTANADQISADRQAAIQERAQAAAEAVKERAAAAAEAAKDRQLQLQIAAQNANAGRFGQPVAGQGVDPATGKTVPGVYVTNAKNGNPEFHPGVVLTPTATARSLPAMAGQKFLAEHPDATAEDVANFAANYGKNTTAARAFGTGKQGQAVNSFNVGLSHLDTLEKLGSALNNGDVQAFNSIGNTFKTQFGNPAPTNFNSAKAVVANEIVKAVTGSAGALGDRETAEKTLSAASSWPQLEGVIGTYKTLMAGQLGGLKQQYENTTGQSDFNTHLSPAALAVFAQHNPAATPRGVPAGSAYSPSRNQWRDQKGKLYDAQGQPVQ